MYDKPFITTVRGASIGGYVDAQYRYERTEGVLEEATFVLERFNLFAYAAISERIRVAAELEFEDGGDEVKIELAIVDWTAAIEVDPARSELYRNRGLSYYFQGDYDRAVSDQTEAIRLDPSDALAPRGDRYLDAWVDLLEEGYRAAFGGSAATE